MTAPYFGPRKPGMMQDPTMMAGNPGMEPDMDDGAMGPPMMGGPAGGMAPMGGMMGMPPAVPEYLSRPGLTAQPAGTESLLAQSLDAEVAKLESLMVGQ